MTIIYYVRHARPNYENHDDFLRELTKEGVESSQRVCEYLKDKKITAIYSSPYRRAVDTIEPFAKSAKLDIQVKEEFRERKITSVWIGDFVTYSKQQWKDFSYKLPEGECLAEVQQRNIKALQEVLESHEGQNVVIGGHGTALSTILNYYDRYFGYEQFEQIKNIMPLIVLISFEGTKCVGYEFVEVV